MVLMLDDKDDEGDSRAVCCEAAEIYEIRKYAKTDIVRTPGWYSVIGIDTEDESDCVIFGRLIFCPFCGLKFPDVAH